MSDPTTVASVGVHNGGRSQITAAFADRERTVDVVTGGTDPADTVHDTVLTAMAKRDIDPSDRTPQEITTDALQACDLIITKGCDADDVSPATMRPDARDWDLQDTAEVDLDRDCTSASEQVVREILAENDAELIH